MQSLFHLSGFKFAECLSQRDYLHEEAPVQFPPVLQTVTAPTVALIEHLFTACDSYLPLY